MSGIRMFLLAVAAAAVAAGCGTGETPTDTGTPQDGFDAAVDSADSDADAADRDSNTDVTVDSTDSDAGDTATGDATDTVEPPLYTNDGAFLRDRQGRAIMLRGINFPSSDVAYWQDKPADQDRTDLQYIAASGFNAIRLVINWDRIEPEPDQYDTEYIALVARHARLAWEAGLYVVVDLHQDMYGVGFGLHGAPRWTCDEANYEAFEPIDPWFFNYYSVPVSTCFDGLWNDPELQSHHHRAAAELAKSLAGIDGVVGFDPINEPFPGTKTFEEFEKDFLGPFYDNFGAVIDAVLPGRIVFFEPAVVFSVQQDTSFATPAFAPAKFFFPHYYNMTVESYKEWDGNAGTDQDWVNNADKQAARLRVPWGLGEMGGDVATANLDEYLLSFYGMLDANFAASFLWLFTRGNTGFGLVDETTNEWHPVAAAFLRPAASLVAGTPTDMSWDPATLTFRLDWTEDPAAGNTEVIIPTWVRTAGFRLVVDGVEIAEPLFNDQGRLVIPEKTGGSRDLRVTVDAPWPGN